MFASTHRFTVSSAYLRSQRFASSTNTVQSVAHLREKFLLIQSQLHEAEVITGLRLFCCCYCFLYYLCSSYFLALLILSLSAELVTLLHVFSAEGARGSSSRSRRQYWPSKISSLAGLHFRIFSSLVSVSDGCRLHWLIGFQSHALLSYLYSMMCWQNISGFKIK